MAIPINLFEFVKYSWESSPELQKVDKSSFSDDLEAELTKIWKDRKRFIGFENTFHKNGSQEQKIIDFGKNYIRPRNLIGSICFRSNGNDYILNILPKIFYKENYIYSKTEIDSVFAHILWWLSSSTNHNYSSFQSSFGIAESNLLEILISIFSSYTLEILSNSAFNYYQLLEDDNQTIKGQIDFNSYLNNISRGNKHIVSCKYDNFQFNNLFNQIIKYVAVLLKKITGNNKSLRNLEDILFLLDEVDLNEVTQADCDKVILNPIYTEYKTILDHCKMFLSSLSVFKWSNEFDVFALLLPSEKLFENLIFSILKQHHNSSISSVSKSRPGRSKLVRQMPENIYRYSMLNDIVVKMKSQDYILLDCKYKKIYNLSENSESIDYKYNIAQSDIYQMVSYAFGSGISEIGLIYPTSLSETEGKTLPVYEIDDAFTNNIKQTTIRITPFKVSLIHQDGLNLSLQGKIENIFDSTKTNLIKELNELLKTIDEKRSISIKNYPIVEETLLAAEPKSNYQKNS